MSSMNYNEKQGVIGAIAQLGVNAIRHVPQSAGWQDVMRTLIHEEDLVACMRYPELAGTVYHEAPNFGSQKFSLADGKDVCMTFTLSIPTKVFVPHYLLGDVVVPAEGHPFVAAHGEWFRPAAEIAVRTKEATDAFKALSKLCGDSIIKMLFFWPALRAVVADLPDDGFASLKQKIARIKHAPKALPSVPPELRASLKDATDFINAMNLIPKAEPKVAADDGWVCLSMNLRA